MIFIDKSIYIPDIISFYSEAKIEQLYEKRSDNEIWQLLDRVTQITSLFLENIPQSISDEEINYHLDRCWEYAKVHEYDVSSCYHYIGKDNDDCKGDVRNLIGIRITSVSPFLTNKLYCFNIIIQKCSLDRQTILKQTNVETVYQPEENALIFHDGKIVYPDITGVMKQYNFEPEVVKKMIVPLDYYKK